jgi:predicted nucleotidyltransferase
MVEPAGARVPDRVRRALDGACQLEARLPAVVAIGLAGSWARGEGRAHSDVDIIVLTDEPAAVLGTTAWFFGLR